MLAREVAAGLGWRKRVVVWRKGVGGSEEGRRWGETAAGDEQRAEEEAAAALLSGRRE